jgi:hypothetical protein
VVFASEINHEAGAHAVAVEPPLLEAATRATERSYIEFPYYEARFGDRGKRFGLSDGAWILTLRDAAPAKAIEQIRWLGAVLSSRGMPQILLERHLEFLFEELQSAPEYNVLMRCARELRKLRQSILPARVFDTLAAEFESESRNATVDIPKMGQLLVCAVCDENLGIEHAVANIGFWAADRKRFPNRWIKAVENTIDRARSAASRKR